MAFILLFHSALGLTSGVHQLAALLREDGHRVATPDLFDGETFRTVEEGVVKRDALGIPELMRRAARAAEACPAESVYAGFSMGVGAAQFLALTRAGARGAILLHALLPLEVFGAERWPEVPVEVHVSERDPWVDPKVVQHFAAEGGATVYTYPGAAHLFADPSSSDYDAALAAQLRERVRAFARSVDGASARSVDEAAEGQASGGAG